MKLFFFGTVGNCISFASAYYSQFSNWFILGVIVGQMISLYGIKYYEPSWRCR